MAASTGLGERDSRRKTSWCDLVMMLATLSGSTDTRSDVARSCAADKNGARIAGFGVDFDLPGLASTKSGPNWADEISSWGSVASLSVENSRPFAAG